jgi:hypothetical protein
LDDLQKLAFVWDEQAALHTEEKTPCRQRDLAQYLAFLEEVVPSEFRLDSGKRHAPDVVFTLD